MQIGRLRVYVDSKSGIIKTWKEMKKEDLAGKFESRTESFHLYFIYWSDTKN